MNWDGLRNGRSPKDSVPDAPDVEDQADDLGEVLARYAAARLTPDPAEMTRMRAALVLQARSRSIDEERTRTHRIAGGSRAGILGLLLRRPTRALAGGLLLAAVATGAAFAASGPGGLLYPVRLWAETLTLPTAAGPRTDAELSRLGSRVADAEGAAVGGNVAGVTAAINAYADELASAQAAADGDPGRLAAVARALAHHRDVLASLVARVPSTADPAIDAALARAQAQIDAVLAGDLPGGQPSTPPGQPSARPSPPAGSPPSPKPGNPSPHPSSPPHPTPSPHGQGGPPSPHPTPRASAHPSPGG